jgi:hypothetical protein
MKNHFFLQIRPLARIFPQISFFSFFVHNCLKSSAENSLSLMNFLIAFKLVEYLNQEYSPNVYSRLVKFYVCRVRNSFYHIIIVLYL